MLCSPCITPRAWDNALEGSYDWVTRILSLNKDKPPQTRSLQYSYSSQLRNLQLAQQLRLHQLLFPITLQTITMSFATQMTARPFASTRQIQATPVTQRLSAARVVPCRRSLIVRAVSTRPGLLPASSSASHVFSRNNWHAVLLALRREGYACSS